MSFDPEQDKHAVDKLLDGASEPAALEAAPVPHVGPAPAAGVEHVLRRTDIDAEAAKRAERQVSLYFIFASLSFVGFVVAFFAIPRDKVVYLPVIGNTNASNFALGLGLGLGALFIGVGAIHWAKKLMSDVELTQERHDLAPDRETRAEALAAVAEGGAESGLGQRKMLRRSLIGAMALFPLPLIVPLLDMGPRPKGQMNETLWTAGMAIVVDVTYQKIRPEDIPVGGLVDAVPANLQTVEETTHSLNERAKAAIILVRMKPDEIRSQQGAGWDYEGILAYSKICTHVGCPTSLYERRSHHLLCPCHQSTFDLADSGNVVFGPAARRMPQLAITVDSDGYLVARGPFTQPVGPSFWERT
jgi:ubiquinol-cytochrome c reductase iron-sulfur subunit